MASTTMHQIAYKLHNELISSVNHKNFETLIEKYGISECLFNEIEDVLHTSGIDLQKTQLKLTNEFSAFLPFDNGDYGIEVDLLTNDGKKTDLTLITQLNKNKGGYTLGYRLIDVA